MRRFHHLPGGRHVDVVIIDRTNQHGFNTPVNLYGTQHFTAPPRRRSRIRSGPGERLRLRVSRHCKSGPFPSHPASRDALFSAFSDPILGLYTNNASAPLDVRAGLRQLYKFGLYSHCAYVNKTAGLCGNTTAGYQFQPYVVITSDMLSNYSGYTDAIIHNATFADSSSLGRSSRSAYYLLLLGSILATVSLVTFVRSPPGSFVSANWPLSHQWSDQAHLGVLRVHLGSHCGQHIRSRWLSPLDGSHQEGGRHQYVDSSTRPSSSRHRGVHRDWTIPHLGGVRLSGDERHSLYD